MQSLLLLMQKESRLTKKENKNDGENEDQKGEGNKRSKRGISIHKSGHGKTMVKNKEKSHNFEEHFKYRILCHLR